MKGEVIVSEYLNFIHPVSSLSQLGVTYRLCCQMSKKPIVWVFFFFTQDFFILLKFVTAFYCRSEFLY